MATGEILSLGVGNGGIWHLNGNSSDSGPNGNNGTDTSVTYVGGIIGQAASFNGSSSRITINDAASLKPTGNFTVGSWFKTSTTGTNQELFMSGSANTNDAGLFLSVNTANKLSFESGRNTGSVADTDYKELLSVKTVTDGIWHNAIGTWDGATISLIIDGSLVSTAAWANAPGYAATNYVRIGCATFDGSNSRFLNGQIDETFLINGKSWSIAEAKRYYAWSLGRLAAAL